MFCCGLRVQMLSGFSAILTQILRGLTQFLPVITDVDFLNRLRPSLSKSAPHLWSSQHIRCVGSKLWNWIEVMTLCNRPQSPRFVRHELSPSAQVLASWVRIPLEARIYVYVCSAFLLSCVASDLAAGWSPCQGVLPTVCLRNCKTETKVHHGLQRPQIIIIIITLLLLDNIRILQPIDSLN
jgi:hypothetical protein